MKMWFLLYLVSKMHLGIGRFLILPDDMVLFKMEWFHFHVLVIVTIWQYTAVTIKSHENAQKMKEFCCTISLNLSSF